MVGAVVLGIGTGVILSVIAGPAFFALLKTSIERGFRAGSALATGVFFSDVFYVIITFFTAQIHYFEEKYQPLIAGVGSFMLVFIGVYYLLRKTRVQMQQCSNAKHTGYFLKGFLMNLFNPFMLIYWLTVISLLNKYEHFNDYELRTFLGATLLSILCSDVAKSYLASKWRHMISEKALRILNRVAGTAILLFGLRMIIVVFT
ncbi:MAG TPA: LysE family transporter [Anseongella sp.]|nr:LysE family transporter [Anseongella sp.]